MGCSWNKVAGLEEVSAEEAEYEKTPDPHTWLDWKSVQLRSRSRIIQAR